MYRKYIENLEKWQKSKRRKPLIVWGARQVGKSYLIRNLFAEKNYHGKYIYVDCNKEKQFTEFCQQHGDPKEIMEYLSLIKNRTIDSSTLLIFDEAQECLPIISMLKYFNQDYPDIPVIVTGSMVRIKLIRESKKRGSSKGSPFLFPVGCINQFTIYPMNFEEFLLNANQSLYKRIVVAYQTKQPLDDATHLMAMKTFYDYLLIGGMPEAVDIFFDTGSYQESIQALRTIYENYLNDMSLYQASPESIVRAKKIFDHVFTQLNKENKNFKASVIEEGSKSKTLRAPIEWLELAFLVHRSCLVKEKVSVPLIESDESLYRLYLSDSGIFTYQSEIKPTTFLSDSGRNTLSGIFFENYVATELVNAGFSLYYWKGKNNAEFEFVIQDENSNIIPIDVKKKRGSLNSLAKFKEHNSFSYAVKVSQNRYGFDENTKILTIPFYDVFLYLKEIQDKKHDF